MLIKKVNSDGTVVYNYEAVVNLFPDNYRGLVGIYLPILHRLSEQSIYSLQNELSAGRDVRAHRVLRNNMTAEELVQEKAALAKLSSRFAHNRVRQDRLRTQAVTALLGIGIGILGRL